MGMAIRIEEGGKTVGRVENGHIGHIVYGGSGMSIQANEGGFTGYSRDGKTIIRVFDNDFLQVVSGTRYWGVKTDVVSSDVEEPGNVG